MLPLRIVVYLLTFSHIILWEYSLFSMPEEVRSWIEEAWDFDDWLIAFDDWFERIR
jgi:hypothetical protein